MAIQKVRECWLSLAEVLSFQLLFVASLAGISCLVLVQNLVGAMVWGSLVAILPNVGFAWRLFAKREYAPRRFLRRFYAAEFVKIGMTVVLLLSLCHGLKLNAAAVFGGFVVTQLGTWLAIPFVGICRKAQG